MKKIKIVEFFGEPLNYGGQEAFIKNVYSCIDKSKFEFIFITPFECKNTKLINLINENGDRLIVGNNPFETKMRKKYILQTAKRQLNNEFDVVHIHSGSIFTLYNVAKISRVKGIAKIIIHSHASGKKNLKYRIIKAISDRNIEKYADYFFACSDLAGEWKYPKEVLHSKKYFIIKNGIDLKKYRYDEKSRLEYRKKFGFKNEHILIHVGRFSKEKNQLFIIDLFDKVVKKDSTARLLLVGGDGELLDAVKMKIEKMNLQNHVMIMLNRNDVPELLNMSDVFILPSLWEGLPFTGIEAQANGIPCIFSDTITDEINITKSYNKLSIKDQPDVWADKILELFNETRINNEEEISKSGYSIVNVCSFLEKIYGGKND